MIHGDTKHCTENTYHAYEIYFDSIEYFLSSTLITHIDHHFYRLHLNRFTDLPEYLYNVVYTRSLMICDGLCVLNNEFCSLYSKALFITCFNPFVKLLSFLYITVLRHTAHLHIFIKKISL